MDDPTTNEYTLREYVDSPEARRKVLAFYAQYYAGKDFFLDPGRFEWQCLGNPLLPSGRNYLYTIEDASGRMLGHDLLVPFRFRIGDEEFDTLANTNLIVAPELAGKKQGRRLLEKHESLGPVCWGIGSTKVALHVLGGRGWTRIEEPRLYALFLRPRPCLRFSGISESIAFFAAPAVKAMNLLWSAVASLKTARVPGITHERIDRFDPDWDTTWDKALAPYGIHFVRRAEHLNWKYFTRNDVSHRALLFRGEDGGPVAYAVYRRAVNQNPPVVLGRIVDLVCNPHIPGLASHVVRTTIRELKTMDVDGIVGLASTCDLRRAYRANGMIVSRPEPASLLERGFSIAELRKQYSDLWYLTLGDADLDDYW